MAEAAPDSKRWAEVKQESLPDTVKVTTTGGGVWRLTNLRYPTDEKLSPAAAAGLGMQVFFQKDAPFISLLNGKEAGMTPKTDYNFSATWEVGKP